MFKNISTTAKTPKKKSRFDGLDVAASCSYIRSIYCGSKLINIYDGDYEKDCIYVFKLSNVNSASKTDSIVSGGKIYLLVEAGVRFHSTTHFYRNYSSSHTMPSSFTMKLRKHLRNKRFEMITQLGNLDRVIDMKFGVGENSHHIIVELYGQGNLILCDNKYEIMALIRTHDYDVNHSNRQVVQVKVGNIYPVTYATTVGKCTNIDKCSSFLANRNGSNQDIMTKYIYSDENINTTLIEVKNGQEALKWVKLELKSMVKLCKVEFSSKKMKRNKKTSILSHNLKLFLLRPSSGVFHYGPSLIEHCIFMAHLDPNLNFTVDTVQYVISCKQWELLIHVLLVEGTHLIKKIDRGKRKGYIVFVPKEVSNAENKESFDENKKESVIRQHLNKIFVEFQPHLLIQHTHSPHIEYSLFENAVDEFFSSHDRQKRTLKAEAVESSAKQRLDKIKSDQKLRVQDLEIQMNLLLYQASLIELHAIHVDAAIQVVKSAMVNGVDWNMLLTLVQVEQSNRNPVAMLIDDLLLDDNEMVLKLGDQLFCQTTPHIINPDYIESTNAKKVKVSLEHSAHGNARIMFSQYRAYKEKMRKTIEAHGMVLEAAKENSLKQVENAKEIKLKALASISQSKRVIHWFEKFRWFTTTDGYLVLAGRDAHQNELLVKRYLRSGDLYLHADVYGAASCIIRAKGFRTTKPQMKINGDAVDDAIVTTNSTATKFMHVSNRAIIEASHFTVCLSSAWKSGMVSSAWWVKSNQVSKIAPTGEYLGVGGFIIRGRKKFLPPSHLEMGLAVMFRLGDEESIQRHESDRSTTSVIMGNEVYMNDNTKEVKQVEDVNKELVSLESNFITSSHEDEKDSEYIENNINCNIDIICDPISLSESINNDKKEICLVDDKLNSIYDLGEKKAGGISVRNKNLIKKYGSLDAAEKKLLQQKKDGHKRQTAISKIDGISDKLKHKNKGLYIRGKKWKEKKMVKKYANQDDIDRQVALLALHGQKNDKKTKQNGKRSRIRGFGNNNKNYLSNDHKISTETATLLIKNPYNTAAKLPDEVRSVLSKCVTLVEDDTKKIQWEKFDAEVLENLMNLPSIGAQMTAVNRLYELSNDIVTHNFNLSANLSGLVRNLEKYCHEDVIKSTEKKINVDNSLIHPPSAKVVFTTVDESENYSVHLSEKKIVDNQTGEHNRVFIDDTSELRKLTGKPVPEDVLLYAIPVCAPYLSLAQYRYKVKLTPGSQKRGKASKLCVDLFLRSNKQNKIKNVDDRENTKSFDQCPDLIKFVNENDWVQTILGDVNISAPGMSKSRKKKKPK